MMWGGQRELRWSMEKLADDALDRAGVELDPRGYLVGLPLDEDAHDPVLVEPDRDAFDVSLLLRLMSRAAALFDEHVARLGPSLDAAEGASRPEGVPAGAPCDALSDPEAEVPSAHSEHYLAALCEGYRRQVVTEALTEASRFDDRTICVGSSVVVGKHRVFPVLAVLTDPWLELPHLTRTYVDGFTADASFAEAVVNDVLRAASHELDRKHPGSLIGVDAGAVLRSAADHFVNACAARAGQEFAHGLRDALDAVSAQTYEGRPGVGRLVLAQPNHPDVKCEVTFEHEVPVSVPRSFRKALEMSGPGFELLCDGRRVYGLGWQLASYDARSEQCFSVRIVGNGSWELWHGSTPHLRVDNGHPTLPRDRVDAETFSLTVQRLFPDASASSAEILWDMAQACIRQQHGTMLVVHPNASAEGARLLPQAYTVEPTHLGPSAFTALTKVDGAVLVSPEGLCHAVGVILDGAATGTGDISRGARYNSAIRYLAGMGKGSMVIIVSEDGRIDILPQMARRVRRAAVERAVRQLVEASRGDENGVIDYETFARLDTRAVALEFYFDAAQCEAVNEARENVEQKRWAEERVRMQVVPIAPHPAMDDSYFITSGGDAPQG